MRQLEVAGSEIVKLGQQYLFYEVRFTRSTVASDNDSTASAAIVDWLRCLLLPCCIRVLQFEADRIRHLIVGYKRVRLFKVGGCSAWTGRRQHTPACTPTSGTVGRLACRALTRASHLSRRGPPADPKMVPPSDLLA